MILLIWSQLVPGMEMGEKLDGETSLLYTLYAACGAALTLIWNLHEIRNSSILQNNTNKDKCHLFTKVKMLSVTRILNSNYFLFKGEF